MGRTKQLINWPSASGDRPLVSAAYDAIRSICSQMVVVVGHEADAVATTLGNRPFHRVESDPDANMFDSIRIGIRQAHALDPTATIVLQPGDHPEVAKVTLEALIETSRELPGLAIMPEHRGRGGHPVLIPSTLIALLMNAGGAGGLRQFWADHPELCRRLPVDDAGVIRDVDTPDQLSRDPHAPDPRNG